jgi:thiamine pyrophosphate-dependent acetolactate synthase large subunit-like protein
LIDQAPLALATGDFVSIRTIDRALDCVREALLPARAQAGGSRVPLDLQTEEFPYFDYLRRPTDAAAQLPPDPAVVDEIVAMIAEAERPIISADAVQPGQALGAPQSAQESGAPLATTLLGKGLFDGNPLRSISPVPSPPISAASGLPKAIW